MGSARARDACALLPSVPGVYRFRDTQNRVIYIGRATSLRSRVRSYWGDLGERQHLRRMVPQIDRIEALACESVHEAAWLERNLLERSKPRWNRAIGGAEVPVWLELTVDADHPGLALDHGERPPGAGVRFGPYLGADRSRRARSGLLRVWPLQLTGAGRDAAHRAMAEAKGVRALDQERFGAQIAAVLRRDPDATASAIAALVELRQRASDHQAYEVAHQIQTEIEALQWLVAPQRVTGAGPDRRLYGFSGETLLTLTVHRGRIDHWTSERCAVTDGVRRTRDTPDEWRRFLFENARLADELASAQR